MKPTLVILAAGMGSRYGGLKQLDNLGPSGETIMDYSVYDAIRAGFGKVVFVIRKSFEEDFRKIFVSKLEGKIDVELVFQEIDALPGGVTTKVEREKPWGTGHAVMMAKEVTKEPFAVINADDFYGAEAYVAMEKFLTCEVKEDLYSMCGYKLGKTLSDFGSVSRGVCEMDEQSNLITVNERTSINKTNGVITYQDGEVSHPLNSSDVVSMNFWGFHPSLFSQLDEKFSAFVKENENSPKAEFYIPFAVDDLMQEGKVKSKVIESDAEWFGVTYQEDRPESVKKLQDLVNESIYPSNLWL